VEAGQFEKDMKEIKLKRIIPSDLKSNFVESFVVQHTKDHFILSFFEVWPPVIIGTPEVQKKELEALNEVEAKCIARIVVTPERMKAFARIVQQNLKAFEESGNK
jgi:hypothetical protein